MQTEQVRNCICTFCCVRCTHAHTPLPALQGCLKFSSSSIQKAGFVSVRLSSSNPSSCREIQLPTQLLKKISTSHCAPLLPRSLWFILAHFPRMHLCVPRCAEILKQTNTVSVDYSSFSLGNMLYSIVCTLHLEHEIMACCSSTQQAHNTAACA